MREKLSWGVIGTGGIAADFVEALRTSERCRVASVAGSSPAKGRAFAARWALPAWADDLPALLADPAVEAVYVATPHPAHEAQAMACIQAGKPVLCEKPITVDAAGAARLVDAARAREVFL